MFIIITYRENIAFSRSPINEAAVARMKIATPK